MVLKMEISDTKDLIIKSVKPSGSAKNVDFRESHSNRHRTAVRPPNELKICGDLVDGMYFRKILTFFGGDLRSLPLPLDSGKIPVNSGKNDLWSKKSNHFESAPTILLILNFYHPSEAVLKLNSFSF